MFLFRYIWYKILERYTNKHEQWWYIDDKVNKAFLLVYLHFNHHESLIWQRLNFQMPVHLVCVCGLEFLLCLIFKISADVYSARQQLVAQVMGSFHSFVVISWLPKFDHCFLLAVAHIREWVSKWELSLSVSLLWISLLLIFKQ